MVHCSLWFRDKIAPPSTKLEQFRVFPWSDTWEFFIQADDRSSTTIACAVSVKKTQTLKNCFQDRFGIAHVSSVTPFYLCLNNSTPKLRCDTHEHGFWLFCCAFTEVMMCFGYAIEKRGEVWIRYFVCWPAGYLYWQAFS